MTMLSRSLDEAATIDDEARAPAPAVKWSASRRVVFRFAFSYLVLWTLPGPIDPLDVHDKWQALWRAPVAWVGAHVFHAADIGRRAPSDGDRLGDWVLSLCLLAAAALVTGAWSILDRR